MQAQQVRVQGGGQAAVLPARACWLFPAAAELAFPAVLIQDGLQASIAAVERVRQGWEDPCADAH